MPYKTLPGNDYPDPMDLLRDPAWEENWPTLLLRGIYSVMKRERKAGRSSLMEAYIKAFNVVLFGLVENADPARAEVDSGVVRLTNYGQNREDMVVGKRPLDKDAQRRYGKKTKNFMARETKKQLKELRVWIDQLVHELPDDMPTTSPVTNQ